MNPRHLHALALAVAAMSTLSTFAPRAALAQGNNGGGTAGTTSGGISTTSGSGSAGASAGGLGGRSAASPAPTPAPAPAPAPAKAISPTPDFRSMRLSEPNRPDKLTHVGGNGAPAVAFNRRAIGPTADLPTAERARAYQTLDRAALKESLARQASDAAKAGDAARAAELTRRAAAVRLRYEPKDLHNNKQLLPPERPGTSQTGRLVMIEGRPFMVPSKYQALEPPRPPGTAQIPKWQTHRLVVEKTNPAATGHIGQRAYWSRHYEDDIGAKARANAMKHSKFPRAAAALMRHRGYVRIQ